MFGRRKQHPQRNSAKIYVTDDRTVELLTELYAIGRGRGFLDDNGARDERAREIGAELDRMGGFQKMYEVHTMVTEQMGRQHARHLESTWDHIGDWMG